MIFAALVAVRVIVVAALLYAVVIATTSWAVRARHLNPFGPWPRLVRRASDPVLRVFERRLVQGGGSPQDAPLWLVGAVVVGGLILLSLVRWLVGIESLVSAGPRGWARAFVSVAFSLVMAALVVRVIASWFGISRYRSWMRPVFALTDWIVEPIRRILPSVGMIDFSPMVAWLLLVVLRGFLLGLL